MIKGLENLKCNGKKCGCGTKRCVDQRKAWKIDRFDFDEGDKTLILHLDKNFDYSNF